MTETSTMTAPPLEFPKVVLTGRAFDFARSEGIVAIEPDREVMQRIGEIAGTGALYVPDLTILRIYDMRHHDRNIHTAPDHYGYLPASELGRPIGQQVDVISAEELRRAVPDQPSPKRVELSVDRWQRLGHAYIRQVLQARADAQNFGPEQGAVYALDAVSTMLRGLGLSSVYESEDDRILREAASLEPYILHRRLKPLPRGTGLTPQ